MVVSAELRLRYSTGPSMKNPFRSLRLRLGAFAEKSLDASRSPLLRRLHELEQQAKEQGRCLEVFTFMEWIRHAPVSSTPLISVVLPTRDRRDRLERAIASVTRQTYPNWQLVVVDDGSVDATPEFLAGLDDERIRSVRARGLGACAARNIALGLAAGEIIAYLDDDNTFHEEWLKSVAWGFAQSPEASVFYGAFIVDNPSRNRKKDWLPRLYFRDYDHQGLARNNIADMGCIAHRAGLAEARFDESLREMGDWDLFLRLTKEAPPLPLPAIACYYTTDAPNRSSYGPTHATDKARVREKNKR